MEWKKDNVVLDDLELYHFEKYEDTYCFEIKTVETEDAGVYTCVARNSEGEATCDIPLIVNGEYDRPECTHVVVNIDQSQKSHTVLSSISSLNLISSFIITHILSYIQ